MSIEALFVLFLFFIIAGLGLAACVTTNVGNSLNEHEQKRNVKETKPPPVVSPIMPTPVFQFTPNEERKPATGLVPPPPPIFQNSIKDD